MCGGPAGAAVVKSGQTRACLKGDHDRLNPSLRVLVCMCVPTEPRKKRVCVLGAGPSGLVMVKELVEKGHEVRVCDAACGSGIGHNRSRGPCVLMMGSLSTLRCVVLFCCLFLQVVCYEMSDRIGGVFATCYDDGVLTSSSIITAFSSYSNGRCVATHDRVLCEKDSLYPRVLSTKRLCDSAVAHPLLCHRAEVVKLFGLTYRSLWAVGVW